MSARRVSTGRSGSWLRTVAAGGLDAAAGNGVLAVILGWRAGVPGPGPSSASAATWASFARASGLWSVAITTMAVGVCAVAMLTGGWRGARRALTVAAVLLVVQAVLASALFTPWGGINLQTGGGEQQAMVHTLGSPGAAVLAWLPATLLRGICLVLAVLLPILARRPSVWGSVLFGAGIGLLLATSVLGTAALGGALFASDGQRVSAVVVGVCLAAAGFAAQRRAA